MYIEILLDTKIWYSKAVFAYLCYSIIPLFHY